MPKLSFAEVLVQKQQHEEVLGIARVADRYGLRSHVTNAKAFGPVPFGTQRQALAIMLDALPWATKPLHPVFHRLPPGQVQSHFGSPISRK